MILHLQQVLYYAPRLFALLGICSSKNFLQLKKNFDFHPKIYFEKRIISSLIIQLY